MHVYRKGALVAKVEIPGMLILSGKVNRKLDRILKKLLEEKRL